MLINYIYETKALSVGEPVGHISPGSLTGSDNLHDLAPLDAIVTSDGVFDLNLGKLSFFHAVLREQLVFLLVSEHEVLGDQLMLSDIDKELLLVEKLNLAWLELLKFLYSEISCCHL